MKTIEDGMKINVYDKDFEGIVILEIQGYIDDIGGIIIEETFNDLLERAEHEVVVCNMQAIDYIELEVLKAFLQTVKQARANNKCVKLIYPKIPLMYSTDSKTKQRVIASEVTGHSMVIGGDSPLK